MSPGPVLCSAADLQRRLETVTVVDVRWYLDGRSGADAYRAGHIPGAAFCDLDQALTGPASRLAGRHPLPSPERFAERLSAIGVGEDRPVVAYDDTGGGSAGRLVVLLRSLGEEASLLDGGLRAWQGELELGEGRQRTTERRPRPWPASLLRELAAIDSLGDDDVLLDARAPERYRGEVEPIDPRPGHIPGAVNLPWTTLLGDDGCFLPRDELARRFSEVGVERGDQLVASCGSGVTACALLLGAEQAGLGVGRLFVPSFSGWSAAPTRSVALGA